MKNILIDMNIHPEGLDKLKAVNGVNVTVIPASDEFRRIDPAIIADKHILFCSVPPTNMADMKSLKFIQIASAGYSQLFDLGLIERGIRCSNAAGVNDIPIAQWNIAMIINLARNLRGMIRNQEAGIWERPAGFQMDVRGKTLGIWGYGGIGRETARLAKTIGMKVHVLDLKVGPRPTMFVVSGTGDPDGILPDKIFRVFPAPQNESFCRAPYQ